MLSNARKISFRILRVSGRINGSSKFPIRSLSANKDTVQDHPTERHAQAVMPPTTNQQQSGNDPDLPGVSGRINGSSKFPIRLLSTIKDAFQGHTAERPAQAVTPPTTNQQQSGNDQYFLPKPWQQFGAFLVLAGGVLIVYEKSAPVALYMQYTLQRFLKGNVVSTTALDELLSKQKFCTRSVHENEISSILKRTEADGHYFIVYGAKGVGKSVLVDHAVKGRSGVVKEKVTSADTKKAIVMSLAKKCGIAETTDIDVFVDALSQRTQGGTLLTVVFEIERGGTPDQAIGIQAVRSLAKEFASVSNCIVILSEAAAVLEFGRDRSRENFVFIDGFTEAEARDYLHKQKLNITESEIAGVFAKIGTSPAVLRDMSGKIQNKGYSVDQFVKETLKTAKRELLAFALQPILKALKEHPEGVSPDFFNKEEYKGVDLSNPQAVGYAMKRSNAIAYRIENEEYQLLSKAHETALQTYEPPLKTFEPPSSP